MPNSIQQAKASSTKVRKRCNQCARGREGTKGLQGNINVDGHPEPTKRKTNQRTCTELTGTYTYNAREGIRPKRKLRHLLSRGVLAQSIPESGRRGGDATRNSNGTICFARQHARKQVEWRQGGQAWSCFV